jgi:hypothetical protein
MDRWMRSVAGFAAMSASSGGAAALGRPIVRGWMRD